MNRTVARALAFDVVSILVFVAIGRRSHDEPGNVLVGALKVAAPFVVAVGVGWLVARAWRRPFDPEVGIVVWITTVAVGMVLRHWVFDRGTALPFIIVATLFTGVFLVGWRLVAGALQRRAATGTE